MKNNNNHERERERETSEMMKIIRIEEIMVIDNGGK